MAASVGTPVWTIAPWLKFVCHGGDLRPGADRGRVGAGEVRRGPAAGRQLLGEDVGELDVCLLVPVAVGVGDVVPYRVDLCLHRADA